MDLEQQPEDRNLLDLTAAKLRRRADRLRKSARFTIVMIVAVLIGGIVIFITAGRIASNESEISAKKALLAEKKAALADKQKVVLRLQMQVEEFEDQLRGEITGEGGSRRQGMGPLANERKTQVSTARQYLEEAKHDLDSSLKDAESLQTEIHKIESSNEPLQVDKSQIPVLISAIVTRIGSIVLLLFLVKILVPLYRYNTKLSAYYDARADALELFNHILGNEKSEMVLEKLTQVLSPDSIDWEASPSTPTEQALDLTKSILESVRSK